MSQEPSAPSATLPLPGDGPDEGKEPETLPPPTPAPKAEVSAPRGFKPYQEPSGRWITHPKQGPWNTPEAVRVMVFEDDSQPRILKLELGTLPPIEIVRGYSVIIPKDAFSVLKDKMHPQLKCDMNVSPPRRYEAHQTDAKYSLEGTATWQEYLDFRDEQAKKAKPTITRRPII